MAPWSDLPFVFAMWVARRTGCQPVLPTPGLRVQRSEGEAAELAAVLSQARDLGVANVESIAAAEHGAVGLGYDECLTYLRDHLHFYLGTRELAGLRLFREHALSS